MIAKAFKTIDLSEQVARQNRESNQANVDGIKNFAESFVTNRQGSINEARQLMSDYDAVINEVDDMHKENVANEIATAQSELAKNIYKSKWNGTRLNLKELNSDGFNYARDMRKLKNLATNSRMSRESLDNARNYAKTHRFFKSSQQRTEYLAEIANYYSSPEMLKASPEKVQEEEMALRLKYTDIPGEAVEIIVSKMKQNKESSYSMKDGDEYETTVTSYGDLFKDGIIDKDKIKEHAQLYVIENNLDQGYLEDIEKELTDAATSTVTDRNIRKEQLDKERLGLEAQKVAAKEKKEDSEKIEFTNDNIVEFSSQMASSDREVADKAVKRFNASSQVKKSMIFSNQSEYTQAMIETDRDALKREEVTSREDGEVLASPLIFKEGRVGNNSVPLKMITKPIIGDDEEAEAKRIEKNNNNIIIQSLRDKYKVEGNQIDFSKMNLEDRILYSRLGQAEDYDDEVSAWIENYKRVEEYYADKWPSDLSPDSEVMFTRFKDDKLPPTLHDRFDKGMNQTQIRNLNNNSTGAIEDQVNPTVKEGELD